MWIIQACMGCPRRKPNAEKIWHAGTHIAGK